MPSRIQALTTWLQGHDNDARINADEAKMLINAVVEYQDGPTVSASIMRYRNLAAQWSQDNFTPPTATPPQNK